MPLIDVDHVSKVFRARRGARALLGRGGMSDWFRGRGADVFTALDDISFSVDAGETLGIIGSNGSGKSTLLKLLAGVTVPTTGHITVRGRVASLLELGAGFHPMLTGRENVYLNAGILGMRHAEVDDIFDAIVDFSGIRAFIDNPVDTYSSGMYVRIAFAVAAYVNPDIFLVDEVLSVGDEEFQRKCRTIIGAFREQGKTIVFVSHDLSIVNTLCDRVILLNKGRMLVRATPQETVDYYLRQIGEEHGIHRFGDERIEVIFSHGRLSVFVDEREVSAPMGFRMQFQSMEQWHMSTSAAWTVVERGAHRCVAHGKMPRLPLTVVWELRIEDARLRWRISFKVERAAPLQFVDLNLFLPTAYTQWHYGEMNGEFPPIEPSDLSWNSIIAPEITCHDAIVEADDAALPPLLVHVEPDRGYLRLMLSNSDYVTGCRVIHVNGHLPDTESPILPGSYPLLDLELDWPASPEAVAERVAALERARTVHAGDVTARFEQGWLRLAYRGVELTKLFHVYSSILIGNLWNDSMHLVWSPVVCDGTRLEVSGKSRRFGFAQHWHVEASGDGVGFDIVLEVHEPLEVQEHQTSIGLRMDYEHWESSHESGAFQTPEPGHEAWRHANRDYTPGKRLAATSTTLPAVVIELTGDSPPLRMTAIDTGYSQQTRVLQALRTPDTGLLRYEPGRYPYFSGIIRIREQ